MITHAAAVPIVRVTVKAWLSYRNDAKIDIFFAANKNKNNAKAALTPSKS